MLKTPTYELRFSAFKRFETDGDRFEFESNTKDGYFIRRRKLAVFCILLWLYGDEKYVSPLEDLLWAICSEYTWCLPAHLHRTGLSELQKDDTFIVDLFASETAEGIAETLSLVGDKLSPIVTERCLYEVKRRVLDRCTEHHSWHDSTQNWVCVCSGNCGIAALYIEKNEDRLVEIVTKMTNLIQNYYDSITPDGACSEGLGYWAYGFGNYVYFADMLYRRTSGEINLFDNEKMKKTASFFSNCLFPKGQYASFADMWGKNIFYALPGLLSKIKEIYPDVRIGGYELMDFSFPDILRLRFGRELREFVWVDPLLEQKTVDDFNSHIYNDAHLYFATSENLVSLAAKGGHNAEAHNHNDVGSFMLIKNGERILDDIGACEYTSAYFAEDTRYTFFAASSLSHNLPIINGTAQAAGKEHAAKNIVITDDGLSADISGAYCDKTLSFLERKLIFDKKCGKLTIVDNFNFTETPKSLVERFVSPVQPRILNDKIVFGKEENSMTMGFDPERFDVKTDAVTDISHDNHTERITYVVDLILKTPSVSESIVLTVE